ncbi:hypothetical protein DICPUDRAFT_157281 [Dictyostelium purpureum]|uniref:Uncharacterized protein n=1 Tax=Dictyostelium purpureum TaxID=5786 RepID=F0ZYQ6_DICPU|nr:uncharacterized protein DICPUDRAFT_157281 [Dictyostelium purpureum]EGC30919.1 hypothetical protein DICPUDRAFT_157281 [Dictyostelium purpureum]|eukprot:XP_003292548.1 hypothetical protein DICPUDRAFT_157281 [Dictyostelium purpureum]
MINDQSRVIQRAKSAGVEGMVIITNDFEKSETSIAVSQAHQGSIYSVVGIHPSNISSKKMSDKLFLQLVHQLKIHAVNPNVVAIYTGLDYERDYGLKFPQEKFLKAQVSLAAELGLPVVLQDFGSGDGLLEVLKDCRKDIVRGMIYSYSGSSSFLQKFIDMDFYISFNGLLCEESDKGDQIRDFITKVPKDRILLVSDSPNHTPQNIPDQYIKEQRNEPSNLVYVLEVAAKQLEMSVEDLAKQLKQNAIQFYSLVKPIEPEQADVEENKEEEEEEKEEKVETKSTKPSKKSTKATPATKDDKKSKSKPKSKKKQQIESEDEDEEDEGSDNEDSDNEDYEDSDEENAIKTFDRNISKLSQKELENIHYSCKKCRTRLFNYIDLIQHEEKSKVLDHNYVKQQQKQKQQQQQQQADKEVTGSNNSRGCKSFFLSAAPWMKVDITKNNIKVVCPKCETKLGSFSHSGEKCSCGSVVQESCRVLKARVDTVLVGDNGQLLDLSLLNIDDIDSSDDDGMASGKTKKKKQAKKNIKKDNKRNLSNYRNKNESGSRKKKTNEDSDSDNEINSFLHVSDDDKSDN